jgi:alpha-glucosidase
MVWEASANNAGFSSHQTWLPVSSEQTQQAVDVQERDENSLLQHWRKVIAFRQAFTVLREGKQLAMQQQGDLLTFVREDDHSSLFCAFNLSDEAIDFALPLGHWDKLDIDLGETCVTPHLEAGVGTTLAAWQCCFARRNLG